MKNGMFTMESIVMNLTGCDREIANTVVNAILDADEKQNEALFITGADEKQNKMPFITEMRTMLDAEFARADGVYIGVDLSNSGDYSNSGVAAGGTIICAAVTGGGIGAGVAGGVAAYGGGSIFNSKEVEELYAKLENGKIEKEKK